MPAEEVAQRDIEALMRSFSLQGIRRYFRQNHWEEESRLASLADEVEPGLKLENVAAHSWHVADSALLIAPQFATLDVLKVGALSILHDKLELITGDLDPVGPDGRGTHTHAFNDAARIEKRNREKIALDQYLSGLNDEARQIQAALFVELEEMRSENARFVKAIDRLQSLAFVLVKKDGHLSNVHIAFSLKYSRLSIRYFPQLRSHYLVLADALLRSVAGRRAGSFQQLEEDLIAEFGDYLRHDR